MKDSEALASTIAAVAGEPGSEEPPPPAAHGAMRFDVIREIGRGGMGRVLEATDAQFGRRVALKELARDSSDIGAVRRFVVESLVTGNLEHPGIPAVYERGVRDGVPYYAMRHVRGRPFSEVLAERRTLAERLTLLAPIVQVANTLGFAHDRGVVHRDVKPENIMLAPHGEVVLLDWGIAKVRGTGGGELGPIIPESHPVAAEATREGAVVGTPAYLSPEQASGKTERIDERTDVFALGALLYHVIAGKPPYTGTNMATLIAAASEASFEPLSLVAPEAPVELVSLVEKSMARLPDDRFQSAGELADALEAFLSGSVLRRPSKFVTALTYGSAGLGVLMLLLISVQLWSLMPTLREQGMAILGVLVVFAVHLVLSVVEWRTRGRYRLRSFLLALAGASFLLGLATVTAGATLTLGFAAQRADRSEIVVAGVYESLGGLITTGVVTAIELLIWGLLTRMVPVRAEAGGLATTLRRSRR